MTEESFTASTPDNAVFVRVAVAGHTLGVQIERSAMRLAGHKLAERIMACNDVAYLKGQLVVRDELDRAAIPVDGMPTEGGTWRAWIALKDHCGNSAELLFTFEIWARRFSISTDSLKPATVNAPYSASLTTAGVRSNVTWAVTGG